jgi:monoamine oxidase
LELVQLAVQPIIDFINKDPKRNWALVIKEYDGYSMYTFLKQYHYEIGTTFSEGAVEMIGVLLALEGFMELSFLEILQ